MHGDQTVDYLVYNWPGKTEIKKDVSGDTVEKETPRQWWTKGIGEVSVPIQVLWQIQWNVHVTWGSFFFVLGCCCWFVVVGWLVVFSYVRGVCPIIFLSCCPACLFVTCGWRSETVNCNVEGIAFLSRNVFKEVGSLNMGLTLVLKSKAVELGRPFFRGLLETYFML